MNDICKDYLMHSWGKTPERKQLEQNYNADYYSKNKLKWVINRQKRRDRVNATVPKEPERPFMVEPITGTASYFNNENGEPAMGEYAEKGLKNMASFAKKIWNVFKKTTKTAKNVGAATVRVVKSDTFKKILSTPIRLIGKTDFGKDVKKVFSTLNRCKDKGDIGKYF